MNKELTAAPTDNEKVPKISAKGTSPPYPIKNIYISVSRKHILTKKNL